MRLESGLHLNVSPLSISKRHRLAKIDPNIRSSIKSEMDEVEELNTHSVLAFEGKKVCTT